MDIKDAVTKGIINTVLHYGFDDAVSKSDSYLTLLKLLHGKVRKDILLNKLSEETKEILLEAKDKADTKGTSEACSDSLKEELGDLFLVLFALCNYYGLDWQAVMYSGCYKFNSRIESCFKKSGIDSFEGFSKLWDSVKAEEKNIE